MADLFYGATLNIAYGRQAIASIPTPGYSFMHFLIQHSGIGDGNIYIVCHGVWGMGDNRIYKLFVSRQWDPINANPWSNTASPNTNFIAGNMILDKAKFNLLCPTNVVSTVITITPFGLLLEPVIGDTHLYYQAETIESTLKLIPITKNLDPSPPHLS
jgi:hypothetical protein